MPYAGADTNIYAPSPKKPHTPDLSYKTTVHSISSNLYIIVIGGFIHVTVE